MHSFSLIFWYLLFVIAVIGSAAASVFLGMTLVAARHFKREYHQRASRNFSFLQKVAAGQATLPRVTMLKPVHGLEPRMEENLEGYFQQDYPNYEVVFGCRYASDQALTVVERLKSRYPDVECRVVLSGDPEWPNAKVYSLDKMIASSTSDYFVITDSDIRIRPDFLRRVIPHLLNPEIGLVTCLYQGVPANDFWSGLEALGMSVELPSGVLVANMLEGGMRFALGAVMGVKREALEKIGGIRVTSEYYSDDFELGNRIAEQTDYKVILGNPGVGHVLTSMTFAQTFRTQLRWMQSTRYSRPKGHFGTGLTFSMPFGILGLIAAAALGHWPLAIGLCAWGYLNRVIQCLAIGWGVVGDPRAKANCLIYPLRDLLGSFVWAASYVGGSKFNWRGEIYRFTPGGRIVKVS